MDNGLPFYGISSSQHFYQEYTRTWLWNLHEAAGAPCEERALGEVALILVSPRRWKWWEKQLSGREKKWRKWWETFHVVESVLDSSSAKSVSPMENATDNLYLNVIAMGNFGPSLSIVHLSVIVVAFWLCHTFLCTSLMVLTVICGVCLCYLQVLSDQGFLKAVTLRKMAYYFGNPTLISSVYTALHDQTELFWAKMRTHNSKLHRVWRIDPVNQSEICALQFIWPFFWLVMRILYFHSFFQSFTEID